MLELLLIGDFKIWTIQLVYIMSPVNFPVAVLAALTNDCIIFSLFFYSKF